MTPALEEAVRRLRLAHRDRSTLVLLARIPEASMASLGFHAQQAVEKALKAVSVSRGV
jgi:HEPN domain-containing protein